MAIINGIRIVEAIKEAPMQTVMGIVVGFSIWVGMWIMSAEIVHASLVAEDRHHMAVTERDQEESDQYHALVREMHETLIRIDENVKHLKNN